MRLLPPHERIGVRMKCQVVIHNPFNLGWGVKCYLEDVSLTFEVAEPGWVGNTRFMHHERLELGDEIRIILNGQTLWLGRIMERRQERALPYADTSAHQTPYSYVAQGIAEHFLDLPFVFDTTDFARDRQPFGALLWNYLMLRNLFLHTARYLPIVDDVNTSSAPPELSFQRTADCWRWFRAQTPCKIECRVDDTRQGQIWLVLRSLPLTPYTPPPEHSYEYTTSIYETATRITLTPPARQLVPDRTLSDPKVWQVGIPTGTNAIVYPQDPRVLGFNERGYLNTFPCTVAFYEPYTTDWVTIKLVPKIQVIKNLQGQRYTHVIGIYARGINTELRFLVNGVASSPISLDDRFSEITEALVPNVDELDLAIQVRAGTATNPPSTFANLDAPYLTVGTSPLGELSQPKPIPLADAIPSTLSPHIIFRANSVFNYGDGTYGFTCLNMTFSSEIIDKQADVLHYPYLLRGTVTNVITNTTVVISLPNAPSAPQPGDLVRIYHPTIPNAPATSEQIFDTRYAIVDTPSAPLAPTDLIHSLASPKQQFSIRFAPQPHLPMPEIGQTVLSPDGNALPIYRIEYNIVNNHLIQITLHAGMPDLTMKALLRQLRHPRQQQI